MSSAFRLPGATRATRSRLGYQPVEKPGTILQRHRVANGIPLKIVADRMGVAPASLALLESGENVRWHTLADCARVLGVGLEIDLSRSALHGKTAAQIAAASGLDEGTARTILKWLCEPRRDDGAGIYLQSLEAFLNVFNTRIMVV